jgi:MFS family permease
MAEGYVRARQRDEYGGTNWGAAFFGWLVAVGLGALLVALLSAAGTAIAISEIDEATGSAAETVGIVGGILILAVTLIAYFAGGYVAGRMSRFDGARQGLGVWIWSIAIAIVLAILGAVAGSEYNLFAGLELPRIPVDEGDVTTGGLILLALVLVGTLLAAMAGGKAGERYHRKVDAVGAGAAEDRREIEREEGATRGPRERRGPIDRARARTAR